MVWLLTGWMVASALWCAAFYYAAQKKWLPRFRALERSLQTLSEAMEQMAEIQMKTHHKVTANLGEIEGRILDLSVPSQDPKVPLEQRRLVVALAQKGTPTEEILKRVNLPRGETELILNLQRCKQAGASRARRANGEFDHYAQA
jgi:hypothetical protein